MKNKIYVVPIITLIIIGAFFVCFVLEGQKEGQLNTTGEGEENMSPEQINDQSEGYAMLNTIGESSSKYLQPTFELDEINDLPFQNGVIYPNFLPQERVSLSLNGQWQKKRFESDYKFSLEPRTMEWIQIAQENMEAGFLDGETTLDWEVKELPGAENNMENLESIDGVEPYEGGVYYRKTIDVGSEFLDKTIYLKSLGINYVCDIWINGQWVGWHEGGFTPFVFDITSYIKVGETNTICLRIDNPPWGKRLDIIPAVAGTDFFNYTGVIQDIYLEGTQEVMVSRNDIVTQTVDGNKATLYNRMVLTRHDEEANGYYVVSSIYEADKSKYSESPSIKNIINLEKLVYEEERALDFDDIEGIASEAIYDNFVLEQEISLEDVQLWDVYDPNLYVMEVEVLDENRVVIDTHYIQFGVRTVETEGEKILINGSNTFLRGIAKHEEWPGYGRTSTWERIITDFDQMNTLGVNFIRTGHYPNHVNTYLYLDRLGILSMSEIPLWQLETTHFEVLDEKGLDLQMFREMVFSQYNSASVILWSTQNECKGIDARKAYNEKLVSDLRGHYDDSRLITQSAAADQGGPKDASMEPLDVNGWTMYFGVFHGSTPYNGTMSFLETVADYWDKPSINTEYGVWSGDTDSDAIIQNRNYQQVFDALMSYATIYPSGYLNPDGALAGIDYWIMYNWYVNHNQWIDTFGIFHMDREEMKLVGESIQEDYLALKTVDDRNDTIMTVEPVEFVGSQSMAGSNIVIEVPMPASQELDGYNYLQVAVTLEETMPMVHLILEDAQGNQFDYYTDKIVKQELSVINIPFYRMEDIDVLELKSVAFSFKDEQNVLLDSISIQ